MIQEPEKTFDDIVAICSSNKDLPLEDLLRVSLFVVDRRIFEDQNANKYLGLKDSLSRLEKNVGDEKLNESQSSEVGFMCQAIIDDYLVSGYSPVNITKE